MKLPSIAIHNGQILLGVPGRTFILRPEDLARLRAQSGSVLIQLEIDRKAVEAEREAKEAS